MKGSLQLATTATIDSPVGRLLVAATDAGICRLEFAEHAPAAHGRHPHLERLKQELAEYFAGERTSFSVPLIYDGTTFQRSVWDALLRIPYGKTCSYDDIARAVGAPRACRAVGQANGCNRIAIVIPCHRVIAKDGGIGGYGGELWRKQFLLDLEQRAAE
jgi:O-6-methylguanine DNA methyltransferase